MMAPGQPKSEFNWPRHWRGLDDPSPTMTFLVVERALSEPLWSDRVETMNTEQLQQLKTLVTDADDLPEAAKNKLLELLEQTETTVGSSEPVSGEGQLLSSVEGFEAAHPEATGFMNRLATTLANMGI